MKRTAIAALSATAFFFVSCGGSADPVEAYIDIANKSNCALAPLAAFYERDEVSSSTTNQDFEPYVEEHQNLAADAAEGLQTLLQEMAVVEWPDYVLNEVDVYLTNVALSDGWSEALSTAETYDEVMQLAIAAPDADLRTGEAVKAKLGVTDEQVPPTDNLDELIEFCS